MNILDRIYWGHKAIFFGQKQMKAWGQLRDVPSDSERNHFRLVSLSQNPKKIADEYLTFIELPAKPI